MGNNKNIFMDLNPTAEKKFKEFFESFPRYGVSLASDWEKEIIKLADEMARDKAVYHVKKALSAATKDYASPYNRGNKVARESHDIEAILNAYPEELIK